MQRNTSPSTERAWFGRQQCLRIGDIGSAGGTPILIALGFTHETTRQIRELLVMNSITGIKEQVY